MDQLVGYDFMSNTESTSKKSLFKAGILRYSCFRDTEKNKLANYKENTVYGSSIY